MRIVLAQINSTVGDFPGNTRKILGAIRAAEKEGAEAVVFPELALCGYPPEDLLFSHAFVSEAARCLKEIARAAGRALVFVGLPVREKGKLYNSAAALRNGRVIGVYHKMLLPNYSVFDEKRYFTPGKKVLILKHAGLRIGVTVCEDIWERSGPLPELKKAGIDLLVNLSASPYHMGKIRLREKILSAAAKKVGAPSVYCNLVGGQDELVFDGGSFAVDAKGRITARAAQFREDILTIEAGGRIEPLPGREEEIFQALTLGIRDYLGKNGFTKALVGISGGIDSALVAVLAAEALGKENILGITLPSVFSSKETQADARVLAGRLGIPFREIPIQGLFEAFKGLLSADFKDLKEDKAEENLQARIRAGLLMAYSNKFNMMLLNTGNKSEASVGYCTLYGDMAGGFAPIKDLPKALVIELSRYYNARQGREVIPESIIERPPTAELRHDQKDTDSLPPYDVLDRILQMHIEKNMDSGRMMRSGLDPARVREVLRMVRTSEYKRRQAPPGAKITPLALGKDRRMPVTNRFDP